MEIEFRVRSVIAKVTWLDMPVVATHDLASREEIEAVAKEVAGAVEASTGIASATVRNMADCEDEAIGEEFSTRPFLW